MSAHSRSGRIVVGVLAGGSAPDNRILPACGNLAGFERVLHFASGWAIKHAFDSQRLRWRLADGSASGEPDYRTSSLRENPYLVDFLKQESDRSVSVSLVLDFDNQVFTTVFGHLSDRMACGQGLLPRALAGRGLTDVEAEFLHGSLNHPWQPGVCPHVPSDELVDLRNRYVYSASKAYEYVYLNPDFYTQQCLHSVERGLADTDCCHCCRLAECLYLFVWREEIMPTLGVLLIDPEAGCTDGKISGYQDDDFATPVSFPVGTLAQVLNQTHHDP